MPFKLGDKVKINGLCSNQEMIGKEYTLTAYFKILGIKTDGYIRCAEESHWERVEE